MTILIRDDIAFQKINISNLVARWNVFPQLLATQLTGDRFITENKFCVLQVPSAVTKGDYNFLLTPHDTYFKYSINFT